MITLDALVANPSLASALSEAERQALVLYCATLLAALAGTQALRAATVPNAQPESPPLTVREAAPLLGFAPSYVYELARRGEIPSVRHGRYVRIRPAAIRTFLEASEQRMDREISDMLSSARDGTGSSTTPPSTGAHTGPARNTTRRARNHRLEVGNRRPQDPGARGEAPTPPREDGAQ